MKRRIISLVFCLLLFCSGCTARGTKKAPIKPNSLPDGTDIKQSAFTEKEDKLMYHSIEDFQLIAEKNGSQLYLLYDDNNLIVAFKQFENGEVIYSSPADYAAGEKVIVNAGAQLLVEYADEGSNIRVVNSLTGSVRTKTAEVKKITDGLLVIYRFTKSKENFDIPVKFVITENGLECSVLFDNIVEKGTSKILNISFLPYMNSATSKDEGYIFLPDGSGTLIDFKGKSSDDTYYSSPVFGRDPVLSVAMLTNVKQNIYLPVFGMQKAGSSMLGVITEGEALATINALQIKGDSAYSNVYSTFIYRTQDEVSLGDSWNAQKFKQQAVLPSQVHNVTVLYKVLQKNDAGYVGMAKEYRKMLIEKGVGTQIKTDVSLYLDVLGAVKKTKSVLGFPQTVVVPFTTYFQGGQILDQLVQSDINAVNMRYIGGMEGGLDDSALLKPSTEKKLGSVDDWKSLNEKAEKTGANIAMNAELVKFYDSISGWKPYKCATQSIYRMPVEVQSFEFSTKLPRSGKREKIYYLMAPEKLLEETNKFFENYSAESFGTIAYGSLGNLLYSDFSDSRFTDRATAQKIVADVLDKASRNGKVWLEGGNSYSLPYASSVIGAPMYDSGLSMSKCEVPFYQIALHGLVEYTQPASNLDTNSTEILKVLETGANPYFIVSWENVYKLQSTNQDWLFSGTWSDIYDSVINSYKEVSAVLNGLNNLEITDHKIIDDNVRVTIYGDKTAVVVNYSDKDVEYCGTTVKAKGYITMDAQSITAVNTELEGEETQ